MKEILSGGEMRIGRPVPALRLTLEEKVTLEQWIRRSKTGQALATRSRIVLACDSGKNNCTIASDWDFAAKPLESGELVFCNNVWMACWMSRDLERPDR